MAIVPTDAFIASAAVSWCSIYSGYPLALNTGYKVKTIDNSERCHIM